jgi:tetratricopeptide (TPR) repeat protein
MLTSMGNLALVYRDQGKHAQAEELFNQVLESRRRTLGEEHPDTLGSRYQVAELYFMQGKYTQAEELCKKTLGTMRRVLGDGNRNTLMSWHLLGGIQIGQHKYAEAESTLRDALAADEKAGQERYYRYSTQSRLGASLTGQGKYDAAEPVVLSGYEGMIRLRDSIAADDLFLLQSAGDWVVELYERWGKPQKAAEWRQRIGSQR